MHPIGCIKIQEQILTTLEVISVISVIRKIYIVCNIWPVAYYFTILLIDTNGSIHCINR